MADNSSFDWKGAFYKATGTTAEEAGIKDEASAQKYALSVQKMKAMQPSSGGLASVQSYGRAGTRNESIYPTN